MSLSYTWRLLCLCCATFFVVHAVIWLVVHGLSSTAVRVGETMKPRGSSRLLFALRMAPVAVTLFLVLGFCVPSYVWLEPDITGERVGVSCLLAAALGVAGPFEPALSTSNATSILPAFSNSSVTGSLLPFFNGLLRFSKAR